MNSVTALSQGSGRILRAGARCRRPPGRDRKVTESASELAEGAESCSHRHQAKAKAKGEGFGEGVGAAPGLVCQKRC